MAIPDDDRNLYAPRIDKLAPQAVPHARAELMDEKRALGTDPLQGARAESDVGPD